MPINLAQIKNELLPGLAGIGGKYEQIETQYTQVFDTGTSQMALERYSQMRFLPLAQIKNEGGSVSFDNESGDRFIYNQEHTEFGLGYAITRKAIEDNLYKSEFPPSNLGLIDSFKQTKEIVCANVLNNGTTYDSNVGGDGVALFSTAHPVDGATFANRPTVDLNLNESALEAGEIAIRYFPDQANLRTFARARKLVVPPQLEYTAIRLLRTELRPGTANNDVNAQISGGFLPDGYVVMDFLTSQYAWFLRTDKKGLSFLQRVPFDVDMQVDTTTQNLLVVGRERYSASYRDPRSIWGSFPSA